MEAAIGTPIGNITVGASGQHDQLLVFYLSSDLRLHYVEQGVDGNWGRDSIFSDVVFENKLTKVILIPNEEKQRLEAYVLTGKGGIFQVGQGGERLSLGKVGSDGKFIPGTDAEFAFFFNLNALGRGRSMSLYVSGPLVAVHFAALGRPPRFVPPRSARDRLQPRFITLINNYFRLTPQ